MELLSGTRLGQIEVLSQTESLYHYTTAKALMNIISTNEFWVTHANFLNDYSEINYIEEVAREAVYMLIPDSRTAEEFGGSLIEQFCRIREGFHQMYLLSFSTLADSLILWSEFSGGFGYCLELCVGDLRRHLHVQGESFRYYSEGRVVYDRSRQAAIIRDEILYPWMPKGNLSSQSEEVRQILPAMAMSLYEYAPFFKRAAFQNEEEYRFIFYCAEDSAGTPDFCSFREKDGNIIPFVKINLKLDYKTKLPIRSIVAGPKNKSDLAIRGAQYLLACHGYGETTIKKSELTLRY